MRYYGNSVLFLVYCRKYYSTVYQMEMAMGDDFGYEYWRLKKKKSSRLIAEMELLRSSPSYSFSLPRSSLPPLPFTLVWKGLRGHKDKAWIQN